MDQDADKTEVVEMLIRFRDSLTEMSLLLKDYQAHIDSLHEGPVARLSSESLDAVLQNARKVINLWSS